MFATQHHRAKGLETMLRILANDFGPHHGFTLLDWDGPESYSIASWQKHYGADGHLRFRGDLASLLHKGATMVGERFLFLHEFRNRDKIDLTAPEYIGVAKLHCQYRNIQQEWQNAAQACGASAFWGDSKDGNDKIKKLGLWQPNKRHAMDSLRHLLYYFTFTLNNDYFLHQLKG